MKALIASFFFTFIAEGLASLSSTFFVDGLWTNVVHHYANVGISAALVLWLVGSIIACAVPATSEHALSVGVSRVDRVPL